MKKIYIIILLIAVSFSCQKEFLEEELVSTLTSEYFSTAHGLNECLNASYNILRWRFNGEHGYSLTNYGTDELTIGNGDDLMHYNNYGPMLSPEDDNKWDSENFLTITDLWNMAYKSIKLINLGLEKIETISEEPFDREEYKLNVKGQFLFLRAFCYLDLVQQFGSVPLIIVNNSDIQTDFPKNSVKEIYDRIVLDLEEAFNYLDEVASEPGRITKGAVAHYLAKVHLIRASEVNRSWNTDYTTDLDKAIQYAELIIPDANPESVYKLEKDYAALFDYKGPNGPNEQSAEIILAAQFTNNEASLGNPQSYHRGNKMHLYVGSWYQDLPGFKRDIENDRPWRRLCPNDYSFDVFDRKNDSRFYKSFKFVYLTNSSGGVPVGDTGIIYIVNSADNPMDQADIDTMRYTVFARYVREADGEIVKNNPDATRQHYCPISKYFDNSRTEVEQEEGYRDGILARLAETYLIAAEAYGRKGDYNKAMEYINYLRIRAGYEEGEVRNNLYYWTENSDRSNPRTKDSLLISDASELTSIPSDSVQAAFFTSTGADTPEKIFIAHILDERARELMCELHRWTDLTRTNTLISRATALNGKEGDYNGHAQPVAGKHELRPIPQVFIDALQKENGTPYSAAEKSQYQNPGY